MKAIQVYDDVHQGVKIEAARSNRTTVETASLLIREGLKKLKTPMPEPETKTTSQKGGK